MTKISRTSANSAQASACGARAEILSIGKGWCDREQTQPWTADTPVLFWSATKGLAAACLLHALQEAGWIEQVGAAVPNLDGLPETVTIRALPAVSAGSATGHLRLRVTLP